MSPSVNCRKKAIAPITVSILACTQLLDIEGKAGMQ